MLTTAAGIALFAWLIWNAGPNDVWRDVRRIGWGFVAVIAIAGIRFALRAAAWARCLEPPHTLPLGEAFPAVVSGDALGNLTPLGPLVGEPAKAAFVRTRVPLAAAFTALAVENVFYTLSVAAVIAAGTIALLLRGTAAASTPIAADDLRLAAEAAIALVLATYVAVAWALLRQPALLSRMVEIAGRLWPSARLQSRRDKVRRLEHDIYTFTARRRQTIGPLIATELGFHVLGVLEVHFTLWLLGLQPRLADSFIFETTNRLTTVLFKFVPQQLGVNEGATVLTAQVLGLGAQAGTTLGVVRRVRMLFWQLVGMALLVRHGITARRILDDAELAAPRLHEPATRAVHKVEQRAD